MFRFTIRDLLWLTIVVALAVGWWIDRTRLAQDYHQVAFDLAIASAKLRAVAYEHKQQRFWP